MESSDVSQIIVLFVLLVLSAFFSSAETCLTTVNRMRMKSMAEEKVKNASIVLRLIEKQGQMLSAILIGNNIVNLTASSLTTTFAINIASKSGLSGSSSLIIGIATGVLTVLVLIFGEIVPKTMATLNAERLALFYAKPIYALTNVLRPISYLMNQISTGLLVLLHVDKKARPIITENEFLTIVDVSHEEGVIENEERQMITNVVDFGDSLAKDVMVPKLDVAFVSVDATYQEILELYKQKKYTRFPVFQETRDHIVGILNVKDMFFFEGPKEEFQIREIMREPYFTYEYKKTSELFFDMKQESIPMAIVLDEYGSTTGMLTTEDLIEEIVGEIRDEYDLDEEDEISKINDDTYVLLGTARLDDIHEQIGLNLESEDYDSISGHVINLLGHFPKTAERVKDDYAEYTILKASNNRIDRVKMHLLKDASVLDSEED